MEIVEGLKYAWQALVDKKLLKEYAALFVIYSAMLALTLVMILMPLALILVLPLALAYMAANIYLYPKFIHGKLESEKLPQTPFSLNVFIKYILVAITQSFHILLFWRSKKWLLAYVPAILGGALFLSTYLPFAVSPASYSANSGSSIVIALLPSIAILLFAGLVLLIAYTYHSTRLYMMVGIVLCNPEVGLGECSQKSWKMTEGRVLEVFLFTLAFGLIIFVISLPFVLFGFVPIIGQVPGSLLQILSLGAGAYFYAYIYKNVSGGTAKNSAAKIAGSHAAKKQANVSAKKK